jgi:hypothetical protein
MLSIFFLQLYSQYSTLITFRDKKYSDKDGRRTITNFNLNKNKYVLNIYRLKECFNDNCLMKINFVKNIFYNIFNGSGNIEFYMLYYLLIYDIICIIILYLFVFGSIKFGLLKILIQFYRYTTNSKRMQNYNNKLSLIEIIKNKIENISIIREWDFFNPEGFFIIEFLCNSVIFLDMIYLLLLICLRICKRNEKRFSVSHKADDDDNKSSDKNSTNSLENKNNNKKEINEIKNPFVNNFYNLETLSGDSISSSDEEITKQ